MAGDLELSFELEAVTLGTDSDGDEVTSCRVAYSEGSGVAAKTQPNGRNQRQVFSLLKKYLPKLGDEGLPSLDGSNQTYWSTDRDMFVEEVKDRMGKANPKESKRAVTDALNGLIGGNFVTQSENQIGVYITNERDETR
jgi:hypothetical protein